MTRKIVIGIGSNLGNPDKNVKDAFKLLEELSPNAITFSNIYRSKPLKLEEDSNIDIPDYSNAVALIFTDLTLSQLHDKLKEIEIILGRDRGKETKRWQSRIIDLDIIASENETVELPELSVPHKEMHKRDFVLIPLKEVWPDFVHPKFLLSIDEMIRAI